MKALAQPWWVNLLAFIPFLAWAAWRGKRLTITGRQLIVLAVFAGAFGFMEASVVIYLRAATGLLPGYHGTLSDVRGASAESYKQAEAISEFPESLLNVEVLREAATMAMLTTVALLAGWDHGTLRDLLVDVRNLGSRVLCWIVGHRPLAFITQRYGCAVPDTSSLDFSGLVPDLSKYPLVDRGFGGAEAT